MLCRSPYLRGVGFTSLKNATHEQRVAATPFPCGRCLHCRINKSREWTGRLLLEQKTSAASYFLTLTYSDDYLPEGNILIKSDLQKFLKRLRKLYSSISIRYFAVGEYGDKSFRPHFHLALFSSDELFQSDIESCWTFGFSLLAEFNKDTARYVTGYVVKKMTSIDDPRLQGRPPEFMTCSKHNGGIGSNAVKQIADILLANPHFQSRIIREVKQGKAVLPLGRYLTQKLASALSIRDAEFTREFYNYQDEIFEKHDPTSTEYFDNILNEDAAKAHAHSKRHNIKKSKRLL